MKSIWTCLAALVLAALFLPSVSAAREPAPENRTYFVQIMGLADDPYEVELGCLTFGASQVCTLDNQTCLDWARDDSGPQTGKQSGFSLTATVDDDGVLITLTGRGRVDSRGSKSSISVSGAISALDVQMNFAFAGRQVNRGRCRQLVEELQGAAGGS